MLLLWLGRVKYLKLYFLDLSSILSLKDIKEGLEQDLVRNNDKYNEIKNISYVKDDAPHKEQ